MLRVARAPVASALILAVFALPLAMDLCAASCQAASAHLADTSASSCHHQAAAPGFGIGSAPTRCGHDHDSATNSALSGGKSWVLSSAVIATVLPAAIHAEQASWYGIRGSDPPGTVLLTLASHLRI